MARVLWSLICRRGIVDEHTKLASIIDVLDGIDVSVPQVAAADVVPLEFSTVTMWTREDPSKPEEATEQRLRVLGPDGTEGEPILAAVDLTLHRNYRNIVNFRGLKYRGIGDYIFVVELGREGKWTERMRMTLTVNGVSPPNAGE